jgi:hypothetical protein
MKYLKLTKHFAVIALLALIFTACKKVKVTAPLGDAGQTLVKILGGGTPAGVVKNAIDFVPVPVKILVVELRRDIPNATELNKTMIVTVADDLAAVAAENPAYIVLPDAWYTIQGATKVGGSGGTFTFTFNPGEFSKEVYITIPDATVMNPSALYALGFTITSADAGGVISTQKSIVVEIGAKNDYDGIYDNTWTNYHPASNPGYTGSTIDIHMVTSGATTCKMWFPAAGAFGNPAILNGNLSYFGIQEPAYTVNPANNVVTVQNVAAGAVTFYTMNSSFNSQYDPPTKTFYCKWGYSYVVPGVFDPACREWTQTMVYTGPR